MIAQNLTIKLTADELSVLVAALERFDDNLIIDWELDGIPAGQDKIDFLFDLAEKLERIA